MACSAAHMALADPPGPCILWLQGYELQVRGTCLGWYRLQRLKHNLSEHRDRWGFREGTKVRRQGQNAVTSQNRTWIGGGLQFQCQF